MRVPHALAGLLQEGIIDQVLRPLMSGKEADVYLVSSHDRPAVAKIYKTSNNRTFKHRSQYTEGRTLRNTRDTRAMAKRSRYGKAKDEDAWRCAEVEIIYRLRAAGVCVPEPYYYMDGVLVMALIQDEAGEAAPRLAEMSPTPEIARMVFDVLLQEVVQMLCAGVVHGDLSEFNVLYGVQGLVIIDFPQAVDAARNQNARKLLLRDVKNLISYLRRFDPSAKALPFGEELWDAYQNGVLTPDTKLQGRYKSSKKLRSTASVLEEIEAASKEETRKRERENPGPGGKGGKGGKGR